MNLLFAATTMLFAAGAAPAANPAAEGPPSILPFVLIAVLVAGYFFVFAPEKKKQKAYKQQMASIKKNDRVVTIGGIYGVVANVNRDADKITLKVDDDTKMDFTLGAISRVISAENQDKDKDSSKS